MQGLEVLLDDVDHASGLSFGNDRFIACFEVAFDNFGEMVIVEAEL